MIISVSRRTDIPAFYADWFFRRLREGFVLVRNPGNPHQVSRVPLTPDAVEGFVFWTKNPAPMLKGLPLLKNRAYYVQFTLNAYGRDVERYVPSKRDVIIPVFRELAGRIGRERVIWRYDPVFFSRTYTFEYHVRFFDRLAGLLAPFTERCIISFLDLYRNTRKGMAPLGLIDVPPERQEALAAVLADIARSRGLRLETCAETMDLSRYGIGHGKCVDAALLGVSAGAKPGRTGRPACGCEESVDIGAYDSCLHGCRYCYACRAPSGGSAAGRHDPASPFLLGHEEQGDVVTQRRARGRSDGSLLLWPADAQP